MVRRIPAYARAWFEQAEADLRAAGISANGGAYEWACFQSQQAAEKALKAYLHAQGMTAVVTHSVRRLAHACVDFDPAFAALDDDARLLDQHYIPTRYPSAFDEEIPPTRYYEQKDAERCMSSARLILDVVRKHFAT